MEIEKLEEMFGEKFVDESYSKLQESEDEGFLAIVF